MNAITSALTRLFSDPWERSITERPRQEPVLTGASDDSGTAGQASLTRTSALALPAPGGSDTQATSAATTNSSDGQPRYDLRNISPRDFADLTHELYLDGTLSWEEFKAVGFPSELDPRYDETIGALTGEKANPDQPKDMLGQWEQRVDFEKRYNPGTEQAQTAEDALGKLSWLNSAPLDLSA